MIHPMHPSGGFQSRWNTLVRSLLVESSVKHVAMSAALYANFEDGESCFPGISHLERDTGYTDKTVRRALQVLRGMDMARLVRRGVPHKGRSDEYTLQIPDGWTGLPLQGPKGLPFTCAFCLKDFNPKGHSLVKPVEGPRGYQTSWYLDKFIFCTRAGKKAPSCRALWDRDRGRRGEPAWRELVSSVKWEMFYAARGEDWAEEYR
ncbi:hypothetical protein [Nocardiopsis valliformis]|uniref:hypothetical protein n=1 Tax=Nocardiopsis valliformis TaxID=239974 RepID=UPI0003473CFA|nr:hypothetical protein [Nocardiopsis valliformis]